MLAACGAGDYDDQVQHLASSIENKPIGGSPDMWLVKNGLAGPERVALIFGYADDLEFCSQVAQLYMAKFPGDSYSCMRAN